MLSNTNSTQSTYWEGYNADGTFNFGGIYMSNSHGWATGVATALSRNVLGLRGVVGSPAALDYIVEPRPGDLEHCTGRLPVGGEGQGQHVEVSWAFQRGGGDEAAEAGDSFVITVDATNHPNGRGVLRVSHNLLELKEGSSGPVRLVSSAEKPTTVTPLRKETDNMGQLLTVYAIPARAKSTFILRITY